jgi:hypothetical protein
MAPNGSHVRSPSIGEEFWENKQEVCFSDDATWMSRRNDHNSLRSAGSRSKLGVFFCLLFWTSKKVRPAAGKQISSYQNFIRNRKFLFRLLASYFSSGNCSCIALTPASMQSCLSKKSSQKKGAPIRFYFLRASQNCCRSDATSMSRRHSNAPPVRLTPTFFQCSNRDH